MVTGSRSPVLLARRVGQGQWEGLGDQVTGWKSLETDTSISCGTAHNQGHIRDKAIPYPGSPWVSHCGHSRCHRALHSFPVLIPSTFRALPRSLSEKYSAFPLLEQDRGNLLKVTEQIHQFVHQNLIGLQLSQTPQRNERWAQAPSSQLPKLRTAL